MNDFRFEPANRGHAYKLAPFLREPDIREIEATSGREPLEALLDALERSTEARAAVWGEDVGAIFGVAPMGVPGVGSIWMLTGEVMSEKPLPFLRRCRFELDAMREKWGTLLNFVDARNSQALKWAQWMGFEIGQPSPYGVLGLPFYFIITGADLCAYPQSHSY